NEVTGAVRSDSTRWGWGYTGAGQLGIGSTGGSQDLPQQVTSPAATGWASVSLGTSGSTACALRTAGTLWCWGGNASGQLGIGTTSNQDRPHRVTTPAADGWASVVVGNQGDDACAVRSDSTLWCWGTNFAGQL